MRPVSASTAVCTLYDGLRPLAEAHRAGVGLSFNHGAALFGRERRRHAVEFDAARLQRLSRRVRRPSGSRASLFQAGQILGNPPVETRRLLGDPAGP
jgi:hypothetical protein